MSKKQYIKPLVSKVDLDYTFSLQMKTKPPMDPMPRGGTESPANSPSPFQSPFGDKPFG